MQRMKTRSATLLPASEVLEFVIENGGVFREGEMP